LAAASGQQPFLLQRVEHGPKGQITFGVLQQVLPEVGVSLSLDPKRTLVRREIGKG
jgi:hypothetical protein